MPRNCTMHTHSWRGVTFHLKSQSQIIVALIIWVDDTVRPLIVDLLGYYSGDELFVVCEWSTPALKCAQNAANRLIIPFLLLLYYRLDFSSRICWKYSCSRFFFLFLFRQSGEPYAMDVRVCRAVQGITTSPTSISHIYTSKTAYVALINMTLDASYPVPVSTPTKQKKIKKNRLHFWPRYSVDGILWCELK